MTVLLAACERNDSPKLVSHRTSLQAEQLIPPQLVCIQQALMSSDFPTVYVKFHVCSLQYKRHRHGVSNCGCLNLVL